MALSILIASSNPDDLLFLEDVFGEIEESRHFPEWVEVELQHATSWEETQAALQNDSIDALLLDLNLDDSTGVQTFRRAHDTAPGIPILLLLDPADEITGLRLVRSGAADYLLKPAIDCAPLAHAVSTAIERHRSLAALRASVAVDPLTGLPNRGSFLALADRERNLASRLDRRLMMVAASVPGQEADPSAGFLDQGLELKRLEAAEQLRRLAGPSDLVAWLGEDRFGMTVFESDAEPLDFAWNRLRQQAAAAGIRMGSAVYERSRPKSVESLLEEASCGL